MRQISKRNKDQQNQPLEQVICDIGKGVSTRSSLKNACVNLAFISHIEHKSFWEVKKDEYFTGFMQEKLHQFERN